MDILARGEGHVSNVRHCLVDDANDRIITVSAEKIVRCWDSNTFCCIQVKKKQGRRRKDGAAPFFSRGDSEHYYDIYLW